MWSSFEDTRMLGAKTAKGVHSPIGTPCYTIRSRAGPIRRCDTFGGPRVLRTTVETRLIASLLRTRSISKWIPPKEAKWGQRGRVVLVLPHGHDGAGPEHNSARPERFLQLCAGGNLRVATCVRAARLFHLLRAQALGGRRTAGVAAAQEFVAFGASGKRLGRVHGGEIRAGDRLRPRTTCAGAAIGAV